MKRLTEVIENWNSKLKNSKGLSEYHLYLEKVNTIYYNRDGRVVCFGSIRESEMERFERKFSRIYYVGEIRYYLYLKINENINCIGEFFNQSNLVPTFRVQTSEFKRLKKFLKKEMMQPIEYPLYHHKSVNLENFFKKHQISLIEEMPLYSFEALKEMEVYIIEFSDGFKKTLSEKELKYAMEYMTLKNVSIVKSEKVFRYL